MDANLEKRLRKLCTKAHAVREESMFLWEELDAHEYPEAHRAADKAMMAGFAVERHLMELVKSLIHGG